MSTFKNDASSADCDILLMNCLQEWAIEQQKSEREDTQFSRGCLFCNTHITGTRAQYLDHLSAQHNLQLGHPHNLVFVDQLIDKLQEKIVGYVLYFTLYPHIIVPNSTVNEHTFTVKAPPSVSVSDLRFFTLLYAWKLTVFSSLDLFFLTCLY